MIKHDFCIQELEDLLRGHDSDELADTRATYHAQAILIGQIIIEEFDGAATSYRTQDKHNINRFRLPDSTEIEVGWRVVRQASGQLSKELYLLYDNESVAVQMIEQAAEDYFAARAAALSSSRSRTR